MAGLKQLNWASEGVGATAAALVDLSTVAGNKISNPPWVKFQSAGWVNFPSAPTVLEALHLTGKWASYGSIIITMMFVVGCALASWLVNVMGRRSLLLNSLLWSGLALLLLGCFSEASSWLIITLFGAYAVLVGGAQVLQFVYPNEIFPTEIRAAAVGLGTSVSRVGAIIGTYLVPISISTYGIGYTMYFAAGITFLGLLVSWFLAPETSGADLSAASSIEATHSVIKKPAGKPNARQMI